MKKSLVETPMKIGYLMQNGAPDLSTVSGPQLHTLAVINGLKEIGHQVRIVAFQDKSLGWTDDLRCWFPPEFRYSKAKWFRLIESPLRRIQSELNLPYIGFFDSLRYADACERVLGEFDLLYERHGYMGYGSIFTARRLRIPIIIELNGNIIEEIDEMGVQMSSTQRRVGRWVTYQTWRLADHMVVVSQALKEMLITKVGLDPDKISVVLNGVNYRLFSSQYDHQQVCHQYGLSSGIKILFVGTFMPWHGVSLLLKSFHLIQSENPDAQLILVGDGLYREAVETQIIELGLERKVKLLGHLEQNQVASVVATADIAVAPYPFEHSDIIGTPLKILEYMAAGKAIVASTAPIHEIVHDGETGIRVHPANAQTLAQGINRLITDPELRNKLGKRAAEFAIDYSWEAVMAKLDGIFNQVVSARRPPVF